MRSNESRSRRQPATPLWAPVAAACSTRKVPRVAARARPGRSAGTPVLAEAGRRPVVRCAGLTAAGGWQQCRSSRAARVVAPRASTVRIVTACVLKQVPRSDARFLAFAERLFRSLARGRLVPPLRPSAAPAGLVRHELVASNGQRGASARTRNCATRRRRRPRTR